MLIKLSYDNQWQRCVSSDVVWPLMGPSFTTALKQQMYLHVSYFCVVELELPVLRGECANVA